ncbi:Bifunctional glutamine synthetase adenylyltransferase/adenylyl-removing enzyme [bacterium HR15]|nr:Bifunctional glutamine synthetase adenylyltransferase/adenylyl-removing enzyme [bacterium HR15]
MTGFPSEREERLWRRLRGEGVQAELFDRFAPIILQVLHDAPDPARLLIYLDRWLETVGNPLTYYRLFADTPAVLKAPLKLFALSPYMADTLLQNPEMMELLLDPALLLRERARAELHRDLARSLAPCSSYLMRLDRLRHFKQMEYLRITALDLLGKYTLPEVARALSDLADVCVQAALEICLQEMPPPMLPTEKGRIPLVVIAMGKWGGRELNYSSDIDLMFLAADEVREPTQMRAFTRLCEQVVDALSRPMRRGIVFRVDLRLRPEGRFGPILRTLQSARHYYENWAEPWERQALLKARPAAGDLQLGQAFLQGIAPFVYRRRTSAEEWEAIVAQKRRLEAHCRARGEWETDIKNGWGGIRDIEFGVQGLQLLYGGQLPRLRTPNTLEALRRLRQTRLITLEEAKDLHDAYCFLRTVEHRLQLIYGHQTHTLPAQGTEARSQFARYLNGGADLASGRSEPPAFEQVLRRHREVARAFWERLSAQSDRSGESERIPLPFQPEQLTLLGTEEGQSLWEAILHAMGFRQPRQSYALLLIPTVGTQHGLPDPATRRAFERILPQLLTACARTPDPDLALTSLERLADALPNRALLYAAFADSPEVLTRLTELAQSPVLWGYLMTHLELLDMLFGEEIIAYGAKTREAHRESLCQRLASCRTMRARLTNLTAYARREWLRIGARDLWGETTPTETAADLTALADTLLLASWEEAARQLADEGLPDALSVAERCLLLGFGSLGAGDLSYASDWDIAFVCPDELSLPTATALAARFLQLCQQFAEQGAFRPVDARLRPEGGAGALVRTLHGWQHYFEQYAEPWERLSAIRARVLNPESPLAQPFLQILNAFRYGKPLTPSEREAIQHMALRALHERVPPEQRDHHLKLGRGALATIEFWVQQRVLESAATQSDPSDLPDGGTLEMLHWLLHRGVLSRADYEVLHSAWLFLYQLRNRVALLFEAVPDLLPEGERLEKLARSLDLHSAAELEQRYRGTTGAVAQTANML